MGWRRWALISPDWVAPTRMVDVSAFVNLPLYHKVQKFSSGTGSPGWSGKKGRKTVVCVCELEPTKGTAPLQESSGRSRKAEAIGWFFSGWGSVPWVSFNALTLLVGRQEGRQAFKKSVPLYPTQKQRLLLFLPQTVLFWIKWRNKTEREPRKIHLEK